MSRRRYRRSRRTKNLKRGSFTNKMYWKGVRRGLHLAARGVYSKLRRQK